MDFFEVIFGNGRWIYFWHGFEVTMVLTTISVLAGLLLGLIISLMRTSIAKPFKFIKSFKGYNKSKILQTIYNFNPLKTFAKFYISIIRGTPTLVQLLIMYYVVFGSMRTMPKLIIAAIAFAMNSAAYIAEMPQALKNSMPGLIGEGVTMFKETSIVGWIGLGDIMRGADDIRSLTATAFQSLFAAALIYLVITAIFSKVMFKLEKKLNNEESN